MAGEPPRFLRRIAAAPRRVRAADGVPCGQVKGAAAGGIAAVVGGGGMRASRPG